MDCDLGFGAGSRVLRICANTHGSADASATDDSTNRCPADLSAGNHRTHHCADHRRNHGRDSGFHQPDQGSGGDG